MRKLLIALSGARPEILERCPTDRGKFEGIGGAVLTTSVLATVSMAFALYSALGISVFVAVPASLVWGLAILSLDRWLVSSIQPDGPRRWRLAVPRILMAVLLGVVISTPMVLQIFKSEIDAQIVEIKQERANAFSDQQAGGSVGKDVGRLRQVVAEQEKVVASGGEVPQDPAKDPKINALTAERDAQQVQAKKHYDEWQCQLYGGRDCPRKGDGVLARASESSYKKAKGLVDKLNRQIDDRKKQLTATDESAKGVRLAAAKAELPKVQAQLDAAVRQQSDLQASFVAENQKLNGLLIRLRALNEVSGKDVTLNVALALLFLLFLLIECLPVAVKLMQKPGNYEKVLALVARNELLRARETLNMGSRLGAQGGSPAIRDIWTRQHTPDQEPPLTATTPEFPLGARTETGQPAPEPVSLGHEHGTLEDEALREMPDGRTATLSEARGSERSRGFELFPEDDR